MFHLHNCFSEVDFDNPFQIMKQFLINSAIFSWHLLGNERYNMDSNNRALYPPNLTWIPTLLYTIGSM